MHVINRTINQVMKFTSHPFLIENGTQLRILATSFVGTTNSSLQNQ
jgi:hypothetical protein